MAELLKGIKELPLLHVIPICFPYGWVGFRKSKFKLSSIPSLCIIIYSTSNGFFLILSHDMLTAFKSLIAVLEQIESRNLKSIEKVLILQILKPVMFNYQIVSMVMGNIGKTRHPELFFRSNLQCLTLSNRHKNFH